MELGNTISELRGKKGLSQKALAEALGLSTTYLSLIENNKRVPAVQTLHKFCEALDVPLPVLLFLSLSESDVSPAKKEAYRTLVPSLKGALLNFFTSSDGTDKVSVLSR